MTLTDAPSGESKIVFKSSQGAEMEVTLTRLSRFRVVFEIHSPFVPLRSSEVLGEAKIAVRDTVVYSGRAVISNLVHRTTGSVCEATLDEAGWLDVDFLRRDEGKTSLPAEFESFIRNAQKNFRILPEFKLAVADMQIFLMDLQRWLEQVELGIRSQPSGDRGQHEREALDQLRVPIVPMLLRLFGRFEEVVARVEPDLAAAHASYVKRQLHPLVLCSPFMYRTFAKPLGYAGDYEMVNMMARDPYEGSSLFAKLLNTCFLETPPVVAHRNRLELLQKMLIEETCLALRRNQPLRVFNLGCGPAKEIQEFMDQQELSDHVQFTLLDFNDETLQYTGRLLREIQVRRQRRTVVNTVRRSVTQVFKEAAKPMSAFNAPQYDVVYCAGLFDYLTDPVCGKLMKIFYDMLLPGGLLVATNVDKANPCQGWMGYSVDWHLIYRDEPMMRKLVPPQAPADGVKIRSDFSGVNIFVDVRKPLDA